MATEQPPVSTSPGSDDSPSPTVTTLTIIPPTIRWDPVVLSGKALKTFGETIDLLCHRVISREKPALIMVPIIRTEQRQQSLTSSSQYRQNSHMSTAPCSIMATEQLPASHLSDDLSSFAESIHTVSSSSTTWGPGALSGKALKAIGETSLDFLCGVIIRRRLALIRQTLERTPRVFTNPSSGKEWRQRDATYADIDELCR